MYASYLIDYRNEIMKEQMCEQILNVLERGERREKEGGKTVPPVDLDDLCHSSRPSHDARNRRAIHRRIYRALFARRTISPRYQVEVA